MPARQGDNIVSSSYNSLKYVRFTDQLLDKAGYVYNYLLCDNNKIKSL